MNYPLAVRIIILMVVIGCGACSHTAEEIVVLREENRLLTQQVDSLRRQLNSIQAGGASDTSETHNTELVSEADIAFLQKRGLQNPITDIKQDLVKNPKLIPQEGVLGGTMRFYEDQIQVFNRKWVLAYYEDGHRAGNMLLTYDVQNGNITWKVIHSELL